MRIDKLLWCVRLFKTRSLAAKACEGKKVKVNDAEIKTSKIIQPGDVIAIKVIPIWRSYKILDIPKSRVGANLVPQYIIETTSDEDLKKYTLVQEQNKKQKILGIKGRPTKKVRRNMDGLLEF